MKVPPPSIPFHLARAYGVEPARRVDAPAPIVEAKPADGRSRTPRGAERLVAAVVPGGIDFDAPAGPRPTGGASIPMYRHPADRNAAATGVDAGRVIDVRG